MRSRNTSDYITLFFKGIFMGIADAMPGVSGGTIALLLGIYEELIESISELKISLFSKLINKGFNSFWEKLNGNEFKLGRQNQTKPVLAQVDMRQSKSSHSRKLRKYSKILEYTRK